MTDQEPLPAIVERLRPALEIVIGALREAIPSVIKSQRDAGLEPDEDPSLVNNFVRRLVREQVKLVLPEVAEQNGNMSPVLMNLGPYRVRVVHARKGKLPRPKSRSRRAEYASNDTPSLMLNIFPPSSLVVLPDEDVVVENTLTLIWDSKGGQLTQAELCRPSMAIWPGESVPLIARVVVEDDIDIKRAQGDERRRAVGEDDDGEGQGQQ